MNDFDKWENRELGATEEFVKVSPKSSKDDLMILIEKLKQSAQDAHKKKIESPEYKQHFINMVSGQEDSPPEFEKTFHENMWELLE